VQTEFAADGPVKVSVMHSRIFIPVAVLTVFAAAGYGADKKKKPPEPSALDKYLQEASEAGTAPVQPSPGSLWSPASRMTDVGSDVRAAQVDDLVTIVVAESASAVATGATQISRDLGGHQSDRRPRRSEEPRRRRPEPAEPQPVPRR
jgi:flagellar basal body L-ring protein FlgH